MICSCQTMPNNLSHFHTHLRWNSASDVAPKPLASLGDEVFPTDMQWYAQLGAGGAAGGGDGGGRGSGGGGGASGGSSKKGSVNDIFVCTSTDG